MGTRCDFYAGRGKDAQYLGSIGHDAFLDVLAGYFEDVTKREHFDECLAKVFAKYGEIPAENGWPWPWKDSHTTDNAIAFDEGRVWASHYDGCWAPLDDYESPTDIPCEFPDMRSNEEATAEGRLMLRLRHRASHPIGPDRDVLTSTLFHAARLLARLWTHVFEQDGAFWLPDTFGMYDRPVMDLRQFVEALRGRANEAGIRDETSGLIRGRRDTHGEEEWDLLMWLIETDGTLETEKADLTLTTTQPLYFGQPYAGIEKDENPHVCSYLKVLDTEAFREGWRLLNVVLDRCPWVFAHVIAVQVRDMGGLPVPLAEADTWFNGPQADLDGETLEAVSATAEGRERVRKLAACLAMG
jgi:hypothetical protein